MIKEELEQEAKEYLRGQTQLNGGGLFACNVKNLLVGFAEPKEKRIEELEQKLEQTEKDLADYQFNYPTIKELEQENAELKKKLKEKLKNIADKDLSFVAKFDALEKENTELKSGCGMCYRKDKEQLTKAKEIIENIIRVTWGEGWSYSLDWKVKAEQFLKGEQQDKWINPVTTTNDPFVR